MKKFRFLWIPLTLWLLFIQLGGSSLHSHHAEEHSSEGVYMGLQFSGCEEAAENCLACMLAKTEAKWIFKAITGISIFLASILFAFSPLWFSSVSRTLIIIGGRAPPATA